MDRISTASLSASHKMARFRIARCRARRSRFQCLAMATVSSKSCKHLMSGYIHAGETFLFLLFSVTISYGPNLTLIQPLDIVACMCSNNASCDYDQRTPLSPHYSLARCLCPDEYDGRLNGVRFASQSSSQMSSAIRRTMDASRAVHAKSIGTMAPSVGH